MPGRKPRPKTPIGLKSHREIFRDMKAGKPFQPIRTNSRDGGKGKPSSPKG